MSLPPWASNGVGIVPRCTSEVVARTRPRLGACTDLGPSPALCACARSYNSFFHTVLPKVQAVVLTSGSLYSVYALLTQDAVR